jgi:hypothetical protein
MRSGSVRWRSLIGDRARGTAPRRLRWHGIAPCIADSPSASLRLADQRLKGDFADESLGAPVETCFPI